MLDIELDREAGIAILQPKGALSAEDFDAAASIIDPYLEEHGELRGLIIRTKQFPGWESFGSLVRHMKFVRNHHRRLSRVALVTDSESGRLAEKIAGHFVSAAVRHYPFSEFDSAKSWILEG